MALTNASGGFKAVKLRHGNIKNDKLGLESVDGGDELLAIAYLTNDRVVVIQDLCRRGKNLRVIVGQEDARFGRGPDFRGRGSFNHSVMDTQWGDFR